MKKLEETIELMSSEDYKDRFRAEYSQLCIRLKGLRKMLRKWVEGELEFEPDTPMSVFKMQGTFMEKYRTILEARAVMEHIDLIEYSEEE